MVHLNDTAADKHKDFPTHANLSAPAKLQYVVR